MNNIQVFNFENQDIRVIAQDGEPWWVAKDVCDVLGLGNSRKAVGDLDEDERASVTISDTSSSTRKTVPVQAVSEPGLYSLILRSRKPEAKAFKRWITHEVIPAIRKTGGYLSPKVDFSDIDNIQRLLDAWRADREKLEHANHTLEQQEPAIEYFNKAMASQNAISMNAAAKILKIPGVGQNNLYKRLRQNGILMHNNLPYQNFIKSNWFLIVEQPYAVGDKIKVRPKVMVKHKGLLNIWRLAQQGKLEAKGEVG